MANRYWVGNGGNWSDNTNHWAASSGDAPGASLPTSADNVFFDALSFSLAGQTVALDVSANCLDMNWTGATNTPALGAPSNLNIYGSVTYIAAMLNTMFGWTDFRDTVGGRTIMSNGFLSSGYRFLTAGAWTLQDAFSSGGNAIQFSSGTLNTNGQTVTCANFNISNTMVKVLTLGASTVQCTSWSYSGTNLTLNANTATIKVSGTGAFQGGGITTYNEVQLNGTAHTISGSNTLATLSLNPAGAQTLTFTDGTTQTVTTLSRTNTGQIILQGSSTGGWTISDSSGTNSLNYLTISYSTASGGATFKAGINSIDNGNNSGWYFLAQTKILLLGLLSLRTKSITKKALNVLLGLLSIRVKSLGKLLTSKLALRTLELKTFSLNRIIQNTLGLLSLTRGIITGKNLITSLGKISNISKQIDFKRAEENLLGFLSSIIYGINRRIVVFEGLLLTMTRQINLSRLINNILGTISIKTKSFGRSILITIGKISNISRQINIKRTKIPLLGLKSSLTRIFHITGYKTLKFIRDTYTLIFSRGD